MDEKRFTFRCAVYLLLIKDDRILLAKRHNTGWQDGNYSLPSGHLDGNETVSQAAIREAQEEVGINILPEDIQVVHTMHRLSNYEYIDFFVTARTWAGNLHNAEPEKCSEIQWESLSTLPENLIPHVRFAIMCYQKNISFSEFDSRNK